MLERLKLNSSGASFRPSGVRGALSRPKLAVVLPFLSMDGMQLLMSLVTFPHELGNVIESLQEPFKSVPLIWTIHGTALALRSCNYILDWQIQLANHWNVPS